MENLNLDIDSYSLHDLVNLFSLDKSFTNNAVAGGKKKLHEQLQKVSYLGVEKKREIGLFVDSAASKLLNLRGKPDKKEGTWQQQFNNIVTNDSHYIIQNPNVESGKESKYSEGRLAGEESFPAGYLNPINVKTTVVTMNIDTRFRDNYRNTSSSDFVITLPQKQRKIVTMRIGTSEIPSTWYAISRERGNATFIIVDRVNGATINTGDPVLDYSNIDNIQETTFGSNISGMNCWLVTLPDGNYELDFQDKSHAAPIIISMNEALYNAVPGYYINDIFYGKVAPSLTDYLSSSDIIYNVSRVNGKSTFEIQVGASHLADGFMTRFNIVKNGCLANEDIQRKLGWQLGFREEEYFLDSGEELTSEGICLITGPRYFYIAIDDGQKNAGNTFIAAFNKSTLDKNIITRINGAYIMDDTAIYKPANDPGLGIQLNKTREYFGPVNIERLHVSLIDEYGKILDLNNMDWSMTLLFESLYD